MQLRSDEGVWGIWHVQRGDAQSRLQIWGSGHMQAKRRRLAAGACLGCCNLPCPVMCVPALLIVECSWQGRESPSQQSPPCSASISSLPCPTYPGACPLSWEREIKYLLFRTFLAWVLQAGGHPCAAHARVWHRQQPAHAIPRHGGGAWALQCWRGEHVCLSQSAAQRGHQPQGE